MAETQAKITITADDRASPAVQQVAQSFDKLNQSSGTATSGLADFTAGSVASVAAGLGLVTSVDAAARKLIEFGQATIDAGAQMQLLTNRAEVLFGQDFPDALRTIDGMAQSLHRSAGEMLNFAVQSDAFAQSLGLSSGQAEQLSGGMSDLAVKIGEATGQSEQDAFSSLERGLRGMGRALIDVGINLDQHTLQTYLDAQGIHEQYSKLDDASKAIVAYNYLLTQKKLIDEQAIKNQDSYVEKTKELDAAWKTLEETLGHLTVGPATSVIQGLTDELGILDENIKRVTADFSASNLFNLAFGVGQAGGDYVPQAVTAGPATQDEYLGKTLGLTQAQIEQYHAQEMLKGSLAEMPDTTGKAAKAQDELRASLEALDARYETATDDINNRLANLDREHQDKMASLRDQLDKVKESVRNLKDAYTQAMDDITGKEEDAVGKQVTGIQKLKAELDDLKYKQGARSQDSIDWFLQYRSKENAGKDVTGDEKNAYGFSDTAVKQIDDQIKLQQMQKELDDYKKTHPDIVAAGTADAGKSEFARQIEQDEAEKAKKTATYTKDLTKDDGDIASLKKKEVAETEAYGATRSQIIQTQSQLQGFHDQLVIAMEHMELVTKQKLQSMTQQFDALTKAISRAQSQLSSLRGGSSDVNLDSYLARKVQLQAQGVQ